MDLWGEEAVARALAHPCPAPMTEALLTKLREHKTTDRELAAWGRTLPPAALAAVVRFVAGEHRQDLVDGYLAAERLEVH